MTLYTCMSCACIKSSINGPYYFIKNYTCMGFHSLGFNASCNTRKIKFLKLNPIRGSVLLDPLKPAAESCGYLN